jgi:FkbM family methyltransferase
MLFYIKTTVISSVLTSALIFANMPPNGFIPFQNNYFVETGTYAGKSIIQAFYAGFKTIHSIEIDTRLAHLTTSRFKDYNNINIWHGDSGSILYSVIEEINEPITFWLDACSPHFLHLAETTPILRELEQIKRHHIKTHTILIDDMHCVGGPLFDFITKETIIAKIKEINPNYEIRYIPGGDDGEYPNNVMVAQVPKYQSPYLDPQILHKIDKNQVKSIIEIGAYSGLDSLQLHDYYKCPIISFECAPESIKKCRTLIAHHPAIKLVEKAVWDSTKRIDFNYCADYPAASSCYFFDYQTMANRDGDNIAQMIRKYQIKTIKVDAISLHDWLNANAFNQIDLLCISTQGSTLPILKGLGSYLNNVKYIVTQVMYQRIYHDEALFPEINEFMQQHGFTVFNANQAKFFNTVVFVRNDLIARS